LPGAASAFRAFSGEVCLKSPRCEHPGFSSFGRVGAPGKGSLARWSRIESRTGAALRISPSDGYRNRYLQVAIFPGVPGDRSRSLGRKKSPPCAKIKTAIPEGEMP